MLVYLDGKFLNEARAGISVNNRSFRYGDGCFETMKVVAGRLQLPHLHMERLFSTMELLRFEPPSYMNAEYLVQRIEELVQRNQHQALARIRLTIFRGDGGLYDTASMRPHLLIQSWPLPPENLRLNENGLVLNLFRKGYKACDAYANLKSNNYLLYAMAALEARQQQCNDMLVLNQHGRVADSTIANLWIVENDILITPPLEEGPVQGTMRRWILEQAASWGFYAKEEPVTEERLAAAQEIFLTNAIYGLKWVRQVGAASHYACRLSAAVHQQLLQPLWQ
jgi:branched-chain amino acid aminotransferase